MPTRTSIPGAFKWISFSLYNPSRQHNCLHRWRKSISSPWSDSEEERPQGTHGQDSMMVGGMSSEEEGRAGGESSVESRVVDPGVDPVIPATYSSTLEERMLTLIINEDNDPVTSPAKLAHNIHGIFKDFQSLTETASDVAVLESQHHAVQEKQRNAWKRTIKALEEDLEEDYNMLKAFHDSDLEVASGKLANATEAI
ncbi:hypothetical protein M422DRAFT_258574 [Sphaerobolus stellatus SS14]|uniref:Uncharacterized protein n=1 Tax=Sphaerobolus stellatus (strain SS14) TaxID=990650 RepID=A0A0C9VLI7_SPHS4|nr:hypothetical protein M422DRAFT_258574 [Sphaerobolus stellatus SS14]